MTREEYLEELDTIIAAATGFTDGETTEYVTELAEYNEDLAELVADAFMALERAAELAQALKDEQE